MWEIQEAPYAGDAINSYNDEPPAPDKEPLGLETSSPALKLKVNDKATHIQLTCHFEGDQKGLDKLAQQLLGVSIFDMPSNFSTHKIKFLVKIMIS